jgi:hypothetical protein
MICIRKRAAANFKMVAFQIIPRPPRTIKMAEPKRRKAGKALAPEKSELGRKRLLTKAPDYTIKRNINNYFLILS